MTIEPQFSIDIADTLRVVTCIDLDPIPPMQYPEVDHFIVACHRQFYQSVEGFDGKEEDFAESWESTHKIFPLSAYIHGGVSLYLGTHRTCQFDSGQVGWVLVPKTYTDPDGLCDEGFWHKFARSLVNEWNDYLDGDVWQVMVEERDSAEDDWENSLEWGSIVGIVGELNAVNEAKHLAEEVKSNAEELT